MGFWDFLCSIFTPAIFEEEEAVSSMQSRAIAAETRCRPAVLLKTKIEELKNEVGEPTSFKDHALRNEYETAIFAAEKVIIMQDAIANYTWNQIWDDEDYEETINECQRVEEEMNDAFAGLQQIRTKLKLYQEQVKVASS